MKTKLCALFLAVAMLSGCYGYMHFYPAQGPLAGQTPLPVFKAKFGDFSGSEITLPFVAGEVCRGTWTRVDRNTNANGTQTVSAAGKPDMAAVWDAVYGPGFYTAHVLGNKFYGTGVLTGDRGSTVDLEFIGAGHEEGSAPRGVARDNKGNIYKVVF